MIINLPYLFGSHLDQPVVSIFKFAYWLSVPLCRPIAKLLTVVVSSLLNPLDLFSRATSISHCPAPSEGRQDSIHLRYHHRFDPVVFLLFVPLPFLRRLPLPLTIFWKGSELVLFASIAGVGPRRRFLFCGTSHFPALPLYLALAANNRHSFG